MHVKLSSICCGKRFLFSRCIQANLPRTTAGTTRQPSLVAVVLIQTIKHKNYELQNLKSGKLIAQSNPLSRGEHALTSYIWKAATTIHNSILIYPVSLSSRDLWLGDNLFTCWALICFYAFSNILLDRIKSIQIKYCKVRNIGADLLLATLASGSDSLILRSVYICSIFQRFFFFF